MLHGRHKSRRAWPARAAHCGGDFSKLSLPAIVLIRHRVRARCVVQTFQNYFCADKRCPESGYVDRVLELSLHRRARVLRPVLVALQQDYFAPDRELVLAVAGVSRISQLEAEIREYVTDHRNASWLRGRARFRISTRRLRTLVRGYLSHEEKSGKGST